MKHHKYFLRLLACLLALIPLVVEAQFLTGYEYWFDGDQNNSVTNSLSGYEAEIDTSISTQQLSEGLHTLYLRVKQSGEYNYSAVTTSVFFKHKVSNGNQIEYWFDDDYDHHASMTLPETATEELTDITFNLQDNTLFPMGLHKLNLRVSTEGKSLNTVYSSWILKLASGDADIIEYWVDGDFRNKKTVSGHLSASGAHDFVFVDPFDLKGLTPGLHRIYYRVANSNGTSYSAVSMTTVVVGSGATPTLEYWIDDDRKNIGTLSGHEASSGDKGTIFNQSINLGNVSEGVHHLNYRGINSNGIAQTAISSTPIMVKSKYNVDSTAVKVTSYSIAVDNEEPVELTLPYPDQVVDIDKYYDVRDLTKGSHELKLRFANSIGAGVSERSTFIVEEQETPVINLTAQESNGLVNIKFNSIPNDFSYRISRVDANGALVHLNQMKGSYYPKEISFTDNPPIGTFKYYVKGIYKMAVGDNPVIKSNEISVIVNSPQGEIGYVEGEIYYDGKRKTGFTSDVTFFNGTDKVEVRSNEDGVFRLDRIPVGTQLRVYLSENDSYVSSTVSVTVAKGKNRVRIDAQKRFEFPVNNSLDYSRLSFEDEIKYEPGEWIKITVKNYSRNIWRGKLKLKVIAQRYDKEADASIGFDDAQVLPGSVAPLSFAYTQNYQHFYSDVFELNPFGGDYSKKEVTIPLKGIFNTGPTEMFNFYVIALGEDDTEGLVHPNSFLSTTKANPLEYLLEGGGEDLKNKKREFFTNLIVYLCSTVKEVDDITGKASKILGIKEERMAHLYLEITNRIEHARNDEALLNDLELQKMLENMILDCDKYKQQTKDFREKIAPLVDASKSFLDLYGDIKKCIEKVKVYKELSAKTDCQKAVYLSKQYLSLFDTGFTKILKSYIDITERIINNLTSGTGPIWAYNEPQIPVDMYEHHLEVKIKILKEDGDDAFQYFTRSAYIIDSVLVKGWMMENNGVPDIVWARLDDVSTRIWRTSPLKDCVSFRMLDSRSQTNADNPNGWTSGNGYAFGNLEQGRPFEGLWAEIYWNNGRVSYVPLTEVGTNGISYSRSSPWSTFTITFKSMTDDYRHAADVIHLND